MVDDLEAALVGLGDHASEELLDGLLHAAVGVAGEEAVGHDGGGAFALEVVEAARDLGGGVEFKEGP